MCQEKAYEIVILRNSEVQPGAQIDCRSTPEDVPFRMTKQVIKIAKDLKKKCRGGSKILRRRIGDNTSVASSVNFNVQQALAVRKNIQDCIH